MTPKHFLIFICAILQYFCSSGQNLVAYYPFDNSTADFSGNNNDGKFYGGVKATADRFGHPCGALHFNGKNGYIEVPNSASLQSPIKNLSVSCWFMLDSLAVNKGNKWLTLICKGSTTDELYYNPQYRVQHFQSKIQSTISLNTDFTEYDTNYVSHKLEYGRWYFYALVYDGKMVKAFLDNTKIWEFKYEKTFSKNNDPLNIGKDVPGDLEYFGGSIDDLRIYNGALTELELTTLYKENSLAIDDDSIALNCPKDITVANDPGSCFAKLNINKASVDFSCSEGTLRQISGLTAGSKFPIGDSYIVYEAKSRQGVRKNCTVKISVRDMEPPSFNCMKDTILMGTETNSDGIYYNYRNPTASDNCSSVEIKLVEGLASGSKFPLGKTKMSFVALDEANNTSICTFSVYVTNNNSKTIEDNALCPEDILRTSDPNKCGAMVYYTLPRSTDKIKFKLIEGIESGRFFPCGTTQIKLQKTLPNTLIQECSFNIKVTENEAPNLVCMNDTIIYTQTKSSFANFTYPTPEATDNCGMESLERIEGLESGSNFPKGITRIVYQAIDKSGNKATCSFTVNVLDTGKTKKDLREKTTTKTYLPDKVVYTPDLKFKKCQLSLVLYDDGQEDNDTVSVFFNGEEIVTKEMIRLRDHGVIIRTVTLDPGRNNDFIVKAWNIGSISPNTIKIEFYEGNYNTNLIKLKKQKPKKVRVLHSKPGVAGAISIRCTN